MELWIHFSFQNLPACSESRVPFVKVTLAFLLILSSFETEDWMFPSC